MARYQPTGEFAELTEKDKRQVFSAANSPPVPYIEKSSQQLADSIVRRGFGITAAEELLLMLSAWMCDPDNAEEASQYWRQLGNESE